MVEAQIDSSEDKMNNREPQLLYLKYKNNSKPLIHNQNLR